jgi:sugar-specific transcriptional regulator TrmB
MTESTMDRAKAELKVMRTLWAGPRTPADLAHVTGIPHRKVRSILKDLRQDGLAVSIPGSHRVALL